MMPAAWVAGMRRELERGRGITNLSPEDPDHPRDVADDAPWSVLEVIAVLSPGSVPAEAWAISGMDAIPAAYRRRR